MTSLIRSLLLAAAAWLALEIILPAPVHADDYWNGYWGWYDNTYRPYYYRQYARPSYGPTYGYYGPAYGYGPSYGPFGPRYYSGYGYYSSPGVGVTVGPGAGGVAVGPLQFGWR